MHDFRALNLDASEGKLFVASWPNPDARYIALIVHGYAEHVGRYAHVAERLSPMAPRSMGRITSATGARRASGR